MSAPVLVLLGLGILAGGGCGALLSVVDDHMTGAYFYVAVAFAGTLLIIFGANS